MGKNRLNKLFSHLVVMLIFITNKILLSIFWLEYWGDVVKYPNTPFRHVWWDWWVPAGRNVAWTCKYPRNPCFLPRWTPHQKVSYFYHHFKGNVFPNIFDAESLFPTCLVWDVWLLEWTQLVFLAFANIFSKMMSQWRFRLAQSI